eukprot:TRINITY_DN6530_c0_g2_i2.p1 TRINITY_DN6530_c0_g2~~TRINITY_DN6530_c0_g2_i2.p1  ORF type:complete len:333 (+),score=39.60 TRINITY_DN6530_c0_g2_i2:260-1258(+)
MHAVHVVLLWGLLGISIYIIIDSWNDQHRESDGWLYEEDPLVNEELTELFHEWLAKKPEPSSDLWEKLDDTPFSKSEMNAFERFPDFDKDRRMIEISDKHPVPPAPTGLKAVRLARKYGYPDHWRARLRPELFILGPPKSGTTFLHGCLAWSMWGNKKRLLYPPASYRWPVNRGEGGEPLYTDTADQSWYKRWNRTGYRRWDPTKELWIYPYYGRDGGTIFTHLTLQRFPPVEVEFKNYILSDSTPDHIMIPEVAQAVELDFRGSPFRPRFIVLSRDVVDRAFSHYRLFSVDLFPHFGWPPETITVFSEKLDQHMTFLESLEICRQMMYEPA